MKISKIYYIQKQMLGKLLSFLPKGERSFVSSIFAFFFTLIEFILFLSLLTLVGITVFFRTEYGTLWLTRTSQELLTSLSPDNMRGLHIETGELSFIDGISLKNLQIKDDEGLWLEIGNIYIDFEPSKVIQFLTKVDIEELRIEDAYYYRNPNLRPQVEETPFLWEIPKIVLPKPLGKIEIKNLRANNIFISSKVMHLESFGLDVQLNLEAHALLERNKATFSNIVLDERGTKVTGEIIYRPHEIYADLHAIDKIWGKTFPRIDTMDIRANGFVRAKQFPPSEEKPFTVDFKANADFKGIEWLESKETLSAEFETFFSYTTENIRFENSRIKGDMFDIATPYFCLNVPHKEYAQSKGTFSLKDLSMISSFIKGNAEGELFFSGKTRDMQTGIDFTAKNFFIELPEYPIFETLEVSGSTKTRILIEEDEPPFFEGNIEIQSEQASILENIKNLPFAFNTNWDFNFLDLNLQNTNLDITDLSATSSSLSLGVEKALENKEIPLIDGDISIDVRSFVFLSSEVSPLTSAKLNIILENVENQKLEIESQVNNIVYKDFSTDTLTLSLLMSEVNKLYSLTLPNLEGNISTKALSNEVIGSALDIDSELIENLNLDFSLLEENLDLKLQTQGLFTFNTDTKYSFTSSQLDIGHFELAYQPTKQTLSLDKAVHLDFSSGFSTSPINFELSSLKEKGFFNIQLTGNKEDFSILTDMDFPSLLIQEYIPQAIPEGIFQAKADIRMLKAKPYGNIKVLFKDYILRSQEALELSINADVNENIIDWKAYVKREENDGLNAYGTLPLRLSPYPNIDLNAEMFAHVDWTGNVLTIWKFFPLAGLNLTGNFLAELEARGSLSQPEITGKAYLSQANFTDEIRNILISNIDVEADITNDRVFIKGYARDGNPISAGKDLNAIFLNAEIVKEDNDYYIDARSVINTFSPVKKDNMSISLSGSIEAKGSLLSPLIDGEMQVNNAFYNFDQVDFSETSTPTLENVEIVKNAQAIKQEEKIQANTLPFNPRFDLSLFIPQNAIVTGMGFNSVWGGEISLNGTLAKPDVVGSLESGVGHFNFLGKRFDLSSSIISFTDDNLPYYNVKFERENTAIDSIIRISGTGTNVNIELTSEPSMPTDEIIAQTLYEKSFSELSQFQSIQVATTAAQLISPSLADLNLMSATKEALGLDVFGFNTKDTSLTGEDSGDDILSDATLEAGTYLNEKIYFGVEGAFEDSAIKIEVELFPNIDLEARIGTESTQTGIQWKKDY